MSYESPIRVEVNQVKIASAAKEFTDKVNDEMAKDIMQAVVECGIMVDREELVKALRYDREQYNRGYDDAVKECGVKWNKDSLPEDNTNVLIADGDLHRVTLGWYGYGRWHGAYNCEPNVIAWARMPEYPEGVCEE